MKADELKELLDKEGLSKYVSWHKRLFKIGKISFYKVEGKLKFYFLKEKR